MVSDWQKSFAFNICIKKVYGVQKINTALWTRKFVFANAEKKQKKIVVFMGGTQFFLRKCKTFIMSKL